jgi:TonB family protein
MENIHFQPVQANPLSTFLSLPYPSWVFSLAVHLAFFGWLWFLGKPLMLDMTSLDLELVPAVLVSSGAPREAIEEEEWRRPEALKKSLPAIPPKPRRQTPPQPPSNPNIPAFSKGAAAVSGAAGGNPGGLVTRMPRYQIKKPLYPESAKRANIEGMVILQVDIDATGAVKKVVVAQGLGYGCDEAAIAAVQQTPFTPAFSGSEPVPVRFLLPFRFQFEN